MAIGVVKVEREIGGRTLSLETGRVAKLASGAVLARYGDSAVLAAVVRDKPREGLDFFPLTVDYREKTSAAGKFPGGFRKREGAPNEKEILTMRMIDRPIRPLFPDGFVDEILVQVFVLSHDGENDTDVLAGTAASAALALSDAPFEGPTATVRVARVHTDDGTRFVINPTITQMDYSDLDLVLAGHKDGVNMIEVGAAEVGEDVVLDAMKFGYENIRTTIDLINELVSKAGKEKKAGEPLLPTPEITAEVKKLAEGALLDARRIKGKADRNSKVDELRKSTLDTHFALRGEGNYNAYAESVKRRAMAKEAFKRLEESLTRRLIVEQSARADGRGARDIRPIECEVGIFARTHGSAFFQRGETQSLVSCTLGTGKDEQIIDGLIPEYSKKFTLHYNVPPFSTGEAKRITGPGRREIGHGALAERSLLGVLPSPEEFPYTIRVVSDITESNGSSSMASVCGGTLALLDAGVPIKGAVAGISVGRFTDENGGRELFVTDIIGEEDFFGDMDFKVAGTREGITGIQLDLKVRGLNFDQIQRTLEQARVGRLQILDIMDRTISSPRPDISKYAPRIVTIRIDPEKIGKLIGPGGKMIRGLQDKWKVSIDVEDDGTVQVASADGPSLEGARAEIEALCEEIKVGTVYTGKVVSTKDFGAFVEIAAGTDGMCHISELADGYVKSVADVVRIGDTIKVKVINIDDQGRIKLSRKAVLMEEAGKTAGGPEGGGQPQDERRGERGDRGGDRGGRREGSRAS